MQANSLGLNKAVVIAGPTASGKSALALELAEKAGGVVINTDSMQVYRDLRIITARPTLDEERRVQHSLYGYIDAAVNFSAGAWVSDAAATLAQVRTQRRLPIFVGGSGLYCKALTRGLSAVPPIPAEVREGVRARLERDGVRRARGTRTARSSGRRTPEPARPNPHRACARSGGGDRPFAGRLASRGAAALLPPGEFRALFLAPERDRRYARIDARFEAMLEAGALQEVAALASRKLDTQLPAMKAHGVPALIRHIKGEITLEEAAEIGRADTRHYAKRQFTWFRHQLPEFEWVKPEAARGWVDAVIPGWSEGPGPEFRSSSLHAPE
jgi:tRNA dimethylallyltransferase